MARIPDDELERLKREVDLAELARSRGVVLERRGKDLVGLCPFHDETEGSFVVSPEKNLFHCLGCGAGGSVVDLVMRLDGVSFRHAVELLREGLGGGGASGPVRLPSPVEPDASDHELLDQVVRYYRETLNRTPDALAYLERRGIGQPEALQRFEVGFVDRTLGLRLPDKSRKAGAEIRGRLQRLGVIRASGHEHLRGCATFPVRDGEGHVGEVYGRRVDDHLRPGISPHLYLPGPHRGVFNLDAIRESKEVILCEAIVDALTFWVAGFRHVTATFGVNGFTQGLLEAMSAYGTQRVLIAFDRDDAGDAAAKRVADRLAAEGIAGYRVLFPRGMDANEYAQKVTPPAKALGLLLRSAEWMAGPVNAHGPLNTPDPPCETPTETPAAASGAAGEDPVPPSAAEPRPAGPVITDALQATADSSGLPASPIPPSPSPDLPAEVTDSEVVVTVGDRRWRVRGLDQALSPGQLRVNLLVSRSGTDSFHVDTLDLYAHRPRQVFLKHAASELEVKEDVLKQDLGRLLLKLEQLQDERIRAALEPKDQAPPAMTAEERAEALELLKAPDLLDRVVADLERCGVVGEATNKLVAYLSGVSRKLSEPLAVLIQSSSAAGKSALMKAVLSLMPEEERVHYSAMTGQSLFYMGETNLRHKILAIAEEEGAQRASYALKLLQSEGELTIASTGKDPATGRLVTHEYHVEGPVAILLTTTAIDLDEELLSRCLVLSVDEDRSQTRAIHRLQRERRTLEGIRARKEAERLVKLHRNAQRLLRPLEVANPYARRLTFLDTQIRTRRDHEKYLTLIEAVTLLHQHQRQVRRFTEGGQEVEYAEATLDDVAVANRLAAEVLGRTLDELPPQTRRLLELIHGMVTAACERLRMPCSDFRFSRRDIRQHTGWGSTQLKVHLARLEELEYLLIHRGRRGQSMVYELLWEGQGKGGEPFVLGLVDVEKLRVSAYDANRSGSGDSKSGSSRGQVAPKSGSCRGGDPANNSIAASSLGHDSPPQPPRNAFPGASQSPASYVALDPIPGHLPRAAAAAKER
jgi:DNA primase